MKKGKFLDIFVMGQSLGGGVAVYSASMKKFKGKIAGCILENTFTSMHDVVSDRYPYLAWLNYMAANKWPSKNRISKIEVPILFVRSLEDEVIPTIQMQKLMSLTNSSSVVEYQVKAKHDGYWKVKPKKYVYKIKKFITKVTTS